MRRGRSPLTRGVLVLCLLGMLAPTMGGCPCPGGECQDFADAANPSIETGVVAILTGIVNGVFALLDTNDSQQQQQTNFSMSSDPNSP